MSELQVITVEIAGQRYPIRSTLDPDYVTELAAYVERKMQLASDIAPTSDVVGLAILVALNVVDELFRTQKQQSAVDGHLNDRALHRRTLTLREPGRKIRFSSLLCL